MLPSENRSTTTVDVESQPLMRWSAVFAGWVVATGIASMFYVAGLALGFSAINPNDAEATAKGIGMGAAAWLVLTWVTSLFLGGLFASWFDGRSDQTMGALHGITVWGLSITASALLLALGLTQAAQSGATLLGGGAAGAGMAASRGAPGGPSGGPSAEAVTGLQARLTQRIAESDAQAGAATSAPGQAANAPSQTAAQSDARRTAQPVDRQNMAAVATALIKGQPDNAKALLAANTSMSQAQVDQTLQSVSADVEKFKANAKAAADAAARYTAAAMCIAFVSALLALIAAALGGWLGASHIHRVHHLRRYETRAVRPI
jgi:hypothetical protein